MVIIKHIRKSRVVTCESMKIYGHIGHIRIVRRRIGRIRILRVLGRASKSEVKVKESSK